MDNREPWSTRERTLFDTHQTTVQEEVVKRIAGSRFGRKLAAIFLSNYSDTSEILDRTFLIDEGAATILEQKDEEGKQRAAVTIYNDMRILLALISEAQKGDFRFKTFEEGKIDRVMQAILDEVKRREETLDIQKNIDLIGRMVCEDFARRVVFVSKKKATDVEPA